MNKMIIYALSLVLLTLYAMPLQAEDDKPFYGEIELGGRYADVSGDKAKFNEYRDLRSAPFGSFRFGYDTDDGFAKFSGNNVGMKDQDYKIEGGLWGKFKAYIKYNETPHNFTYGAKSFYSGVGTNTLTLTNATRADSNTWPTIFDYSLQRKNLEFGGKIDFFKPFYLDLSYSREERDGIKPTAVAMTTGGGSYFLELPEPIRYVTNVLKAEAGYAKNPLFIALSYYYSEFSNDYDRLYFTNPASTNTLGAARPDSLTLPPSNKYHNYNFKGTLKLPLYSFLSVKAAHSETKGDYNLLNYYINNITGGIQNVTLSDSKFDGKLTADSYNVVLTSRPLDLISGKIYYKYYNKKNKSDSIASTDPGINGGNPFYNHLFDYKKLNYGVDFDISLPANFTLQPGYSYLKVDRHRGDFPETKDNKYFIDLRWSGLSFMTAKIGYEKIDRRADHFIPTTLFATDQAGANIVEKYMRRFDAAPMKRDTYKASLDLYPIESINVGLRYKYKKTNYKETVYGIKDDKSDEYGIDADWKATSWLALNGYFEYEHIKSGQIQRYANNLNGLDINVPPSFSGTTIQYTWGTDIKDKTYNYGVGAEFSIIPKTLLLRLQYDHVRSDGLSDLTFYGGLPAGESNNNDHSNWDDYKKNAFSLRVNYNFSKKLTVFAGYAYEKYTYNDIAYNNFVYTYSAGATTTTSYLTGYGIDPSYKANVLFAGLIYKF